MRKVVLLVMALLLSLTLSSAAFASQSSRDCSFYGDGYSGSVGDGHHGYSWYHEDGYGRPDIGRILDGIRGGWDHWRHGDGNIHGWYQGANWRHHWDNDRNAELYSYIDDNGVEHYFYLDPNREYDVHTYQDQNGTTQYYFEDMGWK